MKRMRNDTKTEMAVNKGLAAALLGDRQTGLKVMAKSEVPPDVVARVMLSPELRRHTDWKH